MKKYKRLTDLVERYYLFQILHTSATVQKVKMWYKIGVFKCSETESANFLENKEQI